MNKIEAPNYSENSIPLQFESQRDQILPEESVGPDKAAQGKYYIYDNFYYC